MAAKVLSPVLWLRRGRAEERGGVGRFGSSWGCRADPAEPLLAEMAVLELSSHVNRGCERL